MRPGWIIAGSVVLASLIGLGWVLASLSISPDGVADEPVEQLADQPQLELTAPAEQARIEGRSIHLPSGRVAHWIDSSQDTLGPAGLTFRHRFEIAELSHAIEEEGAMTPQDDTAVLCRDWALPRIARPGPMPAQIVITLVDADPAEGGEPLKVFEAYSLVPVQDGAPEGPENPLTCRWELY